LAGAAGRLLAAFATAPVEEQTTILRYLDELRADVVQLFPALPDHRTAWWPDAVRCLAWSKSAVVGPVLAGHAARLLRGWRGRPEATVLLGALRWQRCPEGEAVLLKAATSSHHAVRIAAIGSLGWWDPFDAQAVVAVLQEARAEPDASVRPCATGALARVGERAAVEEFVEGLHAEEPALRQRTARTAAEEGLTWLWPDLEGLADGPDADVALVACEALERLRELFLGPLG
jgi:hypothetical protein